MRLNGQKYYFNDFVEACRVGKSKVFVFEDAKMDARKDFNLKTDDAILGFIGEGGLESPHFQNVEIWRNNPRPEIEVLIDSYGFYSHLLYGYVAFMRVPWMNRWVIKSLKKNDKPDPRNLAFAKLAELREKLSGGENG